MGSRGAPGYSQRTVRRGLHTGSGEAEMKPSSGFHEYVLPRGPTRPMQCWAALGSQSERKCCVPTLAFSLGDRSLYHIVAVGSWAPPSVSSQLQSAGRTARNAPHRKPSDSVETLGQTRRNQATRCRAFRFERTLGRKCVRGASTHRKLLQGANIIARNPAGAQWHGLCHAVNLGVPRRRVDRRSLVLWTDLLEVVRRKTVGGHVVCSGKS